MTPASMICTGCQHSYSEEALFCPNCGRPKVREAVGDALVGKVLGERFCVLELIGQGGSGTIYRAEHVTLRRKVAIKVLHNELSRDDLAVERFRREATTVAEIDNEHIVEIHDFGRTPDGRLYLAMELLEGETLDSVLAREKQLSVERAADILIQVGEALMEAHAIGYVHRDLRPRNIYLAVRRGKANFVKLLDFGLAKLVETEQGAASTSLGMTFGDPRYMSPEQARGDRIDRRADIYQLGCVAYEVLTGGPPFTGNRVFDILTKQVTDAPAPLPTRRPGVPLWMESAVAKMLAKDPENRFATTTRMVEALRRGLETGEVMEDEIARRRESIPPPSVSRVMQKMGIPLDGSPPPLVPPMVPAKPELPRGEPFQPGATMQGTAVTRPDLRATIKAEAAPRAESAPLPAPVVTPPAPKPEAVVVSPAAAEDSARRRTGTPRVGVPVVPEVPQPPVAGTIEPPAGRTKRTSSHGAGDGLNISQAWFDEGDVESAVADSQRIAKPKRMASPSSADLGYYDDTEAPRRRWALLGTFVVVAALGTIIYAATRNGGGDEPAATQQPVAAVTTNAIDAAPSQVIEPTPAAVDAAAADPVAADAANVAKTPDKDKDKKVVAEVKPPADKALPKHVTPPGHDLTFPTSDDAASRRPGHVVTPTPTPTPTPPKDKGVSGTNDPVDPYSPGDPGDAASNEKKAEFFANLGAQQLGGGDIAGAAGNFKKAVDLDGKNAVAVTGQGEIALRQGDFGAAIAHLTKASKLAPKSAKVFTLLGEAYLSSAQMPLAAANFKKALQLDPDNARARDGYNEASSRVPPPTDDN